MHGNKRVQKQLQVKDNRIDFADDQNSLNSSNQDKLPNDNSGSDTEMSQEFDNKSMTEQTVGNNELTDNSNGELLVATQDMHSFEILAEDTNTQRKYLENIF